MTPLPADFYNRCATLVARELLGKVVVSQIGRRRTVGRIVETEAYLSANDPACHAARGMNRKNASMFGPPGRAYVYVIHARHCFNLVTEPAGVPSAVLIRALEPLSGIAAMQERRSRTELTDLARGPAMLCEALAIDRALDGWDVTRGRRLWIAADDAPLVMADDIVMGPRIGVTSGEALPLRFYLPRNRFVSKVSRREWTELRINVPHIMPQLPTHETT